MAGSRLHCCCTTSPVLPIITGKRGGTHGPTLHPEVLAPGKHTLTVKILLGPAEPPAPGKAATQSADAPPWHTEITLAPLEFEVIDVADAADPGPRERGPDDPHR